MTLRNIGAPRLRTDSFFDKSCITKTGSGQMEGITGLFFLLFLTVFLCCQLQIMQFRASSLYLEDALAASNLASAVIDLEEYGISENIQISNPLKAYAIYEKALKDNLDLDEQGVSGKRGLIDGAVKIETYIVYNVKEGMVHSFAVTKDHVFESGGVLGEVTAPNGVKVESTGVYSEISFPVKSFLGGSHMARKGKLVDVTKGGKGQNG